MLTIKYNVPVNEQVGENGEIRQITETVKYDENSASTEILSQEIKKLEAQGYDVAVTIKLKMPKE